MSSSPTSSSSSDAEAGAALASMFDVRCAVDFVVGTGRITVREFLHLAPEGVLRLDQTVGADFEVCVHGVPIGQGEVAVIDESAALRVTRLAPPTGVGWE
jgi:flagellar motor switch/type III secretory pathway protein FliN